MQVSWIDPAEVRELLKQIAGSDYAPTCPALPAAPRNFPLPPQAPTLEIRQEQNPLTAHPEPEHEADLSPAVGVASDELNRIRSRLKELRERAMQAGVLGTSPGAVAHTTQGLPAVNLPPDSLAQSVTPPPRQLTSGIRLPIIPPEQKLPAPEPPSSRLEKPTFQAPDRGLADRLGALASWACIRLETQQLVLVDDFGDLLWGDAAESALVLSNLMAWHSSQRTTPSAALGESRRMIKELPGGKVLTILPARTRYGTVSLAAIKDCAVEDEDAEALHRALVMAVEGPNS